MQLLILLLDRLLQQKLANTCMLLLKQNQQKIIAT